MDNNNWINYLKQQIFRIQRIQNPYVVKVKKLKIFESTSSLEGDKIQKYSTQLYENLSNSLEIVLNYRIQKRKMWTSVDLLLFIKRILGTLIAAK
jgi:hypothetical protein